MTRTNGPATPPADAGEIAFTLEPATQADAGEITRLLAASAPETIPLSEQVVRRSWHLFSVVRERPSGRVVGAGALHPLAGGAYELRSVAVDRSARGAGVGSLIVRTLAERCAGRGRSLYCVTVRPDFFERLGFARSASREELMRPQRATTVNGRRRVTMVRPAPHATNGSPLRPRYAPAARRFARREVRA